MVDVRKASAFVLPGLKLIWETNPTAFLQMGVITVLSSVLPVAQAYFAQLIVDSVLYSLQRSATPEESVLHVAPFLALEFGAIFMGMFLTQWRSFCAEVLNQQVGQFVSASVMKKASSLDLPTIENPDNHKKMTKARNEAEMRVTSLMNAAFLLAQNFLTIISFSITIIALNPFIALILLGASIPAFLAQTYYSRMSFRLDSWKNDETMKMRYFEVLLTWKDYAKEIKLFRLSRQFLQEHQDIFDRVFREDQKLAGRRSRISLLWGGFGSVALYICYGWVVFQTIAKQITVGQMTFYISSFRQLQGTFKGAFENLGAIFESGLFLQDLFDFFALPEEQAQSLTAEPIQELGLRFSNVSFAYPGEQKNVLNAVSFFVQPGEKIAIVGENGAGKTTLIKLLAGLYAPTQGKITINGRDVQSFPRAELHQKVSAIFQDFAEYNFSARENVGFGSIENIHDFSRIHNSAQKGGAADMIEQFSEGWDALLGNWFKKGRDLSGGQWQKIALSRAFMGDGEILILDEPTSALDAAKEYEIFTRFKELTVGKIAFLISHRFSTVRMADRIFVLENGEIQESGSHDELMATKGKYSQLFLLQAEGYR